MKPQKPSRFDEELGKAVCDRLGLPHNNTLQDWEMASWGDSVMVTMTVMQAIPLEEFNDLRAAATKRAAS